MPSGYGYDGFVDAVAVPIVRPRPMFSWRWNPYEPASSAPPREEIVLRAAVGRSEKMVGQGSFKNNILSFFERPFNEKGFSSPSKKIWWNDCPPAPDSNGPEMRKRERKTKRINMASSSLAPN